MFSKLTIFICINIFSKTFFMVHLYFLVDSYWTHNFDGNSFGFRAGCMIHFVLCFCTVYFFNNGKLSFLLSINHYLCSIALLHDWQHWRSTLITFVTNFCSEKQMLNDLELPSTVIGERTFSFQLHNLCINLLLNFL